MHEALVVVSGLLTGIVQWVPCGGGLAAYRYNLGGASDKKFQYVGSASSHSSWQLLATGKTCLCRTYAQLVRSFFRCYGCPYSCRQTTPGAGSIALHHVRHLCKFISWRCRLRFRPGYVASSCLVTPNITVKAVAAFGLYGIPCNWAAHCLQRYEFRIFMSVDYSKQWRCLKIRRATFLIVWIGWLGVGPLLTSGIEFVTKSPNYGNLSLFIYAPFFILAGFRLMNFKCPKCGHRYSGVNWMAGSKKCASCGLPKWSNG